MMLSALWRHQAPWSYAVWLALSLGGGVFWSPLGLVILWGGAACISWELVARAWAQHRGFRVLYVLPCPSRWARLRLRHLGYTGPVAARLWEMHVAEGTRWSGGVAAFRHAYTADRARWLRERPSDVGLIVTTFNRLPVEEQDLLASADAWMTAGAMASCQRPTTSR